jgi:hypothetical protein
MTTTYLEKSQVPAFLRNGYSGSKFRAEAREIITIHSDAGLWSGGTRDHYSAVSLIDGKSLSLPGQSSAPWDKDRKETEIELRPGFAIIRHSMFCGKDMGLTFYVHPVDIAQLLMCDDAEPLAEVEKTVLYIIKGTKSGYRADAYRRANISEGEAEAIKARLIKLELLNKSGAITIKGKNAVQGFRNY